MKKKYTAFTLAEVLITLGIIGVVAAMTLPVVIAKIEQRVNIDKLKREYSVLQQAFQKILEENDVNFKNAISGCGHSGHSCLKNLFKAKLKTIKDCDKNSGENLSKCFVAQKDAKQLNGKPVGSLYFNNNATSGLLLQNGAALSLWFDSAACDSYKEFAKPRCAFVVLDVNGPNLRPNTWGKDLFLFFIYPNQIMPADAHNTDGSAYRNDCGVGCNYGLTCASKYIYK